MKMKSPAPEAIIPYLMREDRYILDSIFNGKVVNENLEKYILTPEWYN